MPGKKSPPLFVAENATRSIGRAIGLARLLCRKDIVLGLFGRDPFAWTCEQYERVSATVESIEMVLDGGPRHLDWAASLTHAQRAYVWASFADAYYLAACRAGRSPLPGQTADWVRAARVLGEALGIEVLPRSLREIADTITLLMQEIRPTSVPSGAWTVIMGVIGSPWFQKDCGIKADLVLAMVQCGVPRPLLLMMRQ